VVGSVEGCVGLSWLRWLVLLFLEELFSGLEKRKDILGASRVKDPLFLRNISKTVLHMLASISKSQNSGGAAICTPMSALLIPPNGAYNGRHACTVNATTTIASNIPSLAVKLQWECGVLLVIT